MSIINEADGSTSLSDPGKLVARPLKCIVCPLCLLEDEVGPSIMFDVPASHGDYCYKIQVTGKFTNVRLGYPIMYPEEMCVIMKTIIPPKDLQSHTYTITLFPKFGMPLFMGQPFRVVFYNPKGVVSAIGWFGKFQSEQVSQEMYAKESITLLSDEGVLVTIDRPHPPVY